MKKHSILFLTCLLFATNANALLPKRCLEGAVWEINDWGEEELVSCGKWEQDPSAAVAEQEAINSAYDEEYEAFKAGNYEVIRPEDETPMLGKAQNKLNEISSEVFKKIF